MAQRIELEILSPARLVFGGSAESVIIPSIEGSMGVLVGHAPLLAALKPGTITARSARSRTDDRQPPVSSDLSFAVTGGFARVLPDRVTILAEDVAAAGRP